MGDQPGRGALAVLLDDVAAGWFPPANGEVTFVPPPAPRDAGVIGFTAHAVIFTDADPAWVTAQLPAGGGTKVTSPFAGGNQPAATSSRRTASGPRPG